MVWSEIRFNLYIVSLVTIATQLLLIFSQREIYSLRIKLIVLEFRSYTFFNEGDTRVGPGSSSLGPALLIYIL